MTKSTGTLHRRYRPIAAGGAGDHGQEPSAYARGRDDRSPILSALRHPPPPAAHRGLKVTRWHPDHGIAHLTFTAGRRYWPLDPADLHEQITELRTWGYHGVVTAALAPSDQGVFLDAGFRVVERLHLLRHSLDRTVARSPVTTRRARRRDRPEILAVDQAAFAPFWQLDETMMAEAIAATRSARWRVVCHGGAGGGRVVGYAICGRSGSRGYVQRLAVHPDHQGHGIGTALLADGLSWLMRWGARDALVNTQLDNQRSLRLYQRSGFVLQPEGLAVLRLDFPAARALASGEAANLGIIRPR